MTSGRIPVAPSTLLLLLCAKFAWASLVAIPALVLGSPDYQNNKRKILAQNGTRRSEPDTFRVNFGRCGLELQGATRQGPAGGRWAAVGCGRRQRC